MESEVRKERILLILQEAFLPAALEVTDNSLLHAGHVGSSPSGETHYKIYIRSDQFKNKTLVEQHRSIYEALGKEWKTGLHALEIDSSYPT
ncbi:BolA family transcriptional regulator [Leptospira kobayashii]|uniref:BolA family transcriptional regulator n=1 Tax=Leptospira kobayashii TaxID=1917830 RepID=A0ABN6KEE4_9LEPT|nr:BolA family protein [Leptospira kobayashii]BDA79060.1 BolA family transcriptional regulator [Leptospira kobayashii]